VCLAIPVRVVALLGDQWVEAEVGGVITRVSTALLGEVALDDYLIVHAGFAITRLNIDEAERTLALFAEIVAQLREPEIAIHTRLS
jgi:hydrogenase expression/formation protein HypC